MPNPGTPNDSSCPPINLEDYMADNKTKPGGLDRARINVNEDYEVSYWTRTLEVSQDDLREAIVQAGPAVEAVKKYLGR